MAKENPKRILIPNKSLHHLITNAQITDMSLFVMATKPPVGFSLDKPNTIYYLEVALPIFPYSFYHEMAYLPLYPNVYNFSFKVWKIIYMPTLK